MFVLQNWMMGNKPQKYFNVNFQICSSFIRFFRINFGHSQDKLVTQLNIPIKNKFIFIILGLDSSLEFDIDLN